MRRRILLINPRPDDYYRVPGVLKQFEELVNKGQKPGRRNGCIYTTRGKDNSAYVWYTTNQVSIHFGESNEDPKP